MKWGILLLLIIFSSIALCNNRDSSRIVERQKSKIERQKKRTINRWDERSYKQKRTDRRALIFLAIVSGVIVNTIAVKE